MVDRKWLLNSTQKKERWQAVLFHCCPALSITGNKLVLENSMFIRDKGKFVLAQNSAMGLFFYDCWYAIHTTTHVHSLSQIWRWDLFVASDKTERWIEQLRGSLPGLVFWSSSKRGVTTDSFLSVQIFNSLIKLWKAHWDFAFRSDQILALLSWGSPCLNLCTCGTNLYT